MYLYAITTEASNILASDALSIELGSPRDLISQNPIDNINEISIQITTEEVKQEVTYRILPASFALNVFKEPNQQYTLFYYQYLNAERLGPRIMNEVLGDIRKVAVHGENAAYQMKLADELKKEVHPIMKNEDDISNKFSYYVEKWMSAIMGTLLMDVSIDYNKALSETRYRNRNTEESVIPTMTGFGITYVMPIVVAGLLCTTENNSIFIVENPEAHLHPYAQSNLGKFLALLSMTGVQVIVETHSEHIIDGARLQFAIMDKADEMMINFFDNHEKDISIQPISVNDKGELEYWPKGFFDQKQVDLRELMRLKKR